MRLAALIEGAKLARNIPTQMVPCPICGSQAFETLARQDRYAMKITTSACSGCGLIMTNPQPTSAFLDDFYRSLYRPFYRRVETPSATDIKRLNIDVRSTYTVDRMRALGVTANMNSMLDLGCGDGSLLREVGRQFPQASRSGIEPGSNFRAFARDFAACPVEASLDELDPNARFDVITMIHVLEHVADPVTYLKSLKARLNPGGKLYIDVPDVERYRSVADLHIAHIYHFTADSLARLLEKAGFGVARVERHNPPSHPQSITGIATLEKQAQAPIAESSNGAARDAIRKIDSQAGFQLARVYLIDPILLRLGLKPASKS